MIVLLVSLFGMLAKGHIFLIIAGADAPFVTPATAISYADQALRLNPGNDYAYVVRSRALLQHGNPDQAIADLKTFVARHPDRTEGLELLGHIYFSREEYTAAIRYYTAAIRIQPSPDSLNSRGYCEILTHQDKIARDDFLRILTMDDKYAPAYGNLGLLDAIDGSYDSAIINMQKSYDLDHSLRVVKLLVAALKAEKSGSKFEAIAYYEQFIGRTGGAHEWRAERRFAAERAALLRQE
jgi:tetratricopeptide (TPR) repeat protein